VNAGALKDISARLAGERPPRRPGQILEDRILGASGANRLKPFSVSDSSTVAAEDLRIYALRTATLAPKGPSLELRWKKSPHGSVEGDRHSGGTPVFAEMAPAGTVFTGRWRQNAFFSRPEVVSSLRWKAPLELAGLLEAVNESSERALKIHRRYAEVAGLEILEQNVSSLLDRVAALKESKTGCVVSIGWGGGFLSKSGAGSPTDETHREILGKLSYYSKAIRSGLPFPKTRRIVFLQDRPAALPGWAELEIS
jgi:CRISPR-associated protein Csm5